MRRFLHVRHPVFVLFLILEFDADPEMPVGETSPGPPDGDADWTFSIFSMVEEA
jgi:hypothetical protein